MPKHRLDFERIKQEFRIIDVAQSLCLDVDGDRCKSVFEPGNNDTCTHFFSDTNSFYDWKAARGGSVLDLVAQVKYGNTDRDAIYQAALFLAGDKYEFDGKYWKSWIKEKQHFDKQVDLYHKVLLTSSNVDAVRAREYLHERGITDETIKRFKIGICKRNVEYDGVYYAEPRLFIPYLDRNNEPYYGAHRRLDWNCHDVTAKKKYMKEFKKKSEFLRNEPLGINTLPTHKKDYDLLVITEGAIDWLTAVQEGFHSLSSVCGSFGKENEPVVINICKKFRRVITTYDIDAGSQAGQGFTVKLGLQLLKAGINFYNVDNFGDGHKDLSDYYTAGGDLNELFTQHVMCGAIFIARRLIKEFGNVYYRELSVVEQGKLFKKVRELVQLAKEVVSKEEYEQVKQEILKYLPEKKFELAEKEPSEKEKLLDMRDAFCGHYPYLFHYGDSQHGSYWNYDKDTGIWYEIPDADVHNLVLEFFACNITPEKVSKITTAVRHKRQRTKVEGLPEFNKKPLFVFPKGTFEIEAGTLREHRAEDYYTASLSFDYDKNADCPLFKKIIHELMDNNESRLMSIRDQIGYIFYTSCICQKFFIWYGDGDNGKTLLANTISNVFKDTRQADTTDAFVTAIPLSEFNSPTAKIALRTSRLNIVTETGANLRDKNIAEVLKQICTGDRISGNYKFKDIISFVSATKLFLCCNRIPIINDNTFGMTRRIIFIEFARKFTNCKDPLLEEKLKQELPGIFNYMYQCYLELRQRNYIRECCDQSKLMREFSSNASSVYSFYDSYRYCYSGKTIPTKDVWTEYITWCKESFIPQNEVERNKIFQTEFLRLIQADGSKRERLRLNGKQTYCYVFATISTEAEDDIPDTEYTEAEYEPETSLTDQQPETEAEDVTYSEPEQFTQSEPELELSRLVKLNYSAMSTSEINTIVKRILNAPKRSGSYLWLDLIEEFYKDRSRQEDLICYLRAKDKINGSPELKSRDYEKILRQQVEDCYNYDERVRTQ